ncbi:MAG: hypothetical protein J5537_02870 [Lachnospiraceae bacterium]|nr:hypothetical protein [Lachnospiraceae bacterium]
MIIYRIKGIKNDEITDVSAKVFSLLRLFTFTVSFDGKDVLTKAYILFFKVHDSSKPKKKEEPKEETQTESEEPEEEKESMIEILKRNKDLLLSDETKALLERTLNKLKRIIKHILPKKITGEAHYSAGSPDNTGYIMGLFGMLYPSFNGNVKLYPDFDSDAFFEGKGLIKGRFFLLAVLILALRIALDKQMRKLFSALKGRTKDGRHTT